jgi:acetoin utilization protein AcuC
MNAYTISAINHLPAEEKRQIYSRLIPVELLERFQIPADFTDASGNDLLSLDCAPGSATFEMRLYHRIPFPDPLLYGQMTDTLNGQIHILLYILNDPTSPRFDVDKMPDGRPTKFGTLFRNLDAEIAAMNFGLAPGQVRRGLRLLWSAIPAFEKFVASLGHELFFVEPLYYHNAILFEQHGFSYQKGRKLMERIQKGFAEGGDLTARLDGSTPFRSPQAARRIRLRSWAVHDNLLGEPFTNVTMYKTIGKSASVNTCDTCEW